MAAPTFGWGLLFIPTAFFDVLVDAFFLRISAQLKLMVGSALNLASVGLHGIILYLCKRNK